MLIRWHRHLGVVACVGVLMWAVSGITHPIMSRLKPVLATQAPPAQQLALAQAVPLTGVLARHRITTFDGLRLLSWAGTDYYQIRSTGRVHYFDARNGDAVPEGDARYAEFLARHFLGEPRAPVRQIGPVTAFGGDYTFVNRFLPVQRVAFERADGAQLFVDTQASRLGTVVDSRKSIFQAVFSTLHNWAFLDFNGTLRLTVTLFFAGIAFISACSGLVLYGFLWQRGLAGPGQTTPRRGLRRYHRALGLTVAATTLMFSISGLLHLVANAELGGQPPAPAVATHFAATELSAAGFSALQQHAAGAAQVTLMRLPQGVHYRIATHHGSEPGESHARLANATTVHTASVRPAIYINAHSGAMLAGGEALHARQLAGTFSGLADARIRAVTPVTRFEDEYNAFYKHLPVTRVDYATLAHDRYYVETATGQLAGHVRDSGFATAENWTFNQLHKWHFLDNLGPDKWARDIAMVLFALGNALVATLGLTLFLRHGRSPRPNPTEEYRT